VSLGKGAILARRRTISQEDWDKYSYRKAKRQLKKGASAAKYYLPP
jgi:hypothetical protein